MSNWRDDHKKTKAMIDDRQKYYVVYTPFERIKVDEAIEQRIKMTRPLVEAGARQEWQQALSNLHAAERAEQAAHKREAARWDPARQAMEDSFARSAFDRAWDVKQARIEYDKAMASNDPAKMRAFAERFSTAETKFTRIEDHLEAHRLAMDALRQAEKMQFTDEIIEAQAHKAKRIDELVGLQNEIGAVSKEVDSFDLQRMIEKVHVRARFDGDSGKFVYEVLEEPEAAPAPTAAPAFSPTNPA